MLDILYSRDSLSPHIKKSANILIKLLNLHFLTGLNIFKKWWFNINETELIILKSGMERVQELGQFWDWLSSNYQLIGLQLCDILFEN
jgi:hypothetical protein